MDMELKGEATSYIILAVFVISASISTLTSASASTCCFCISNVET